MAFKRKRGACRRSHPPASFKEIDAVIDRLRWTENDIVYVRDDGREVTRGELATLFAGDESGTQLMIAVIRYGIRHRNIRVLKRFVYGGVQFVPCGCL
jgi:hypothetical protein